MFFENVALLKDVKTLIGKELGKTKMFVLKISLDDLMTHYQRLTTSEAQMFDKKFGSAIDKATRALYCSDSADDINFRDIDVDDIFQLCQDLSMYLDERDARFLAYMKSR